MGKIGERKIKKITSEWSILNYTRWSSWRSCQEDLDLHPEYHIAPCNHTNKDQRQVLCQVALPLGRLAIKWEVERILSRSAELIHQMDQVPTRNHTGSSQGSVHVHQHIHSQGESPRWPGQAVDQGGQESTYLNFSEPNPSHLLHPTTATG